MENDSTDRQVLCPGPGRTGWPASFVSKLHKIGAKQLNRYLVESFRQSSSSSRYHREGQAPVISVRDHDGEGDGFGRLHAEGTWAIRARKWEPCRYFGNGFCLCPVLWDSWMTGVCGPINGHKKGCGRSQLPQKQLDAVFLSLAPRLLSGVATVESGL